MKRPFRKSNQEIPVSCSAGCVITDGSEKLEEIVRVADKAMYRAKHEGRNRYLVEEIYRAT
jgi:PleD family two-component response regulator